MNKQAEHYELTGDKLTGKEQERAYRAAQSHLQGRDNDYLSDYKRLQDKLIRNLESQISKLEDSQLSSDLKKALKKNNLTLKDFAEKYDLSYGSLRISMSGSDGRDFSDKAKEAIHKFLNGDNHE